MPAASHARKPAPALARGRVRLRRCVRANAFGNALGQGLVGSVSSSPATTFGEDHAQRLAQSNPMNLPIYSANAGPSFSTPYASAAYDQLVQAFDDNTPVAANPDDVIVVAGTGPLTNMRAPLTPASGDRNRPPAGGPGRTMQIPEMDIAGNPTGGTTDVPVPDNVLLPGENVKGNVFFGGAGMDGSYIKDMVRAFNKQGIALTPANRDVYSNGTGLDATVGVQLTRFGELPYVPLLDNVPQVGGSQFNLLGYSYGSNVAAQVAVTYARGGTTVDNLVLIGSPISADYLKTLQAETNIKNVVIVNLNDKGDPITAGMSDASLIGSAFTLKNQMSQGAGHFYYAPDTPAAAVRRDALAQYLYQRGLR
ncbi:hypothetical protein [Variovorax terrae]|uniref:Alpha/beta hydrolase n=1 Tax=Variovorax terrae TaxID=2923278 RepID=A0A9X1VWZ9_9BURK|nr:hypothetical protein [Variovorax terrae]MCJ0764520.1 hypothetical protein [Variovorax terrae]